MATLRTKTLTGKSRPKGDAARLKTTKEAAAAMRPQIENLKTLAEKVALDHRREIDSIKDPILRRSLGAL